MLMKSEQIHASPANAGYRLFGLSCVPRAVPLADGPVLVWRQALNVRHPEALNRFVLMATLARPRGSRLPARPARVALRPYESGVCILSPR